MVPLSLPDHVLFSSETSSLSLSSNPYKFMALAVAASIAPANPAFSKDE